MIKDLFATIGLFSIIAYAAVWGSHLWEKHFSRICTCVYNIGDDPECKMHY